MNIILTIIFIIAGLVAFYFFCIRTSEMQDEKTGRIYRYMKDTESPHHAPCKNCGERARLIYTMYGEKHRGTDCMFCHYTIWFDLWKKKGLKDFDEWVVDEMSTVRDCPNYDSLSPLQQLWLLERWILLKKSENAPRVINITYGENKEDL